jgi:hypothetical protein
MHAASSAALTRALHNLSAILHIAEAHATAKKIEPSALITARLAPDMLTLAGQIQRASDAAKGCAARLSGSDIPSFADTETTFDELQARVAATIAFIDGISAAQIDGSETRAITLKLRTGDQAMTGQSYLLGFALPNFYFHVVTAYAILRHNGVEIGKLDFLGKP